MNDTVESVVRKAYVQSSNRQSRFRVVTQFLELGCLLLLVTRYSPLVTAS